MRRALVRANLKRAGKLVNLSSRRPALFCVIIARSSRRYETERFVNQVAGVCACRCAARATCVRQPLARRDVPPDGGVFLCRIKGLVPGILSAGFKCLPCKLIQQVLLLLPTGSLYGSRMVRQSGYNESVPIRWF